MHSSRQLGPQIPTLAPCPLQARELGYAIASEWQSPRPLGQLPELERAPRLPPGLAGGVPDDFPRLGSLAQPATLCYSHPASGRWHQLTDHWWPQVELDGP